MHADVESFLEVGVGSVFSCDPGGNERCTTAIRGWRCGGYVLLDLPAFPIENLERAAPCVVRFVSNGQACGFQSRVLKTGTRSSPYIEVAWPDKVETVEFRRHQRVEVCIDCRVREGEGAEVAGTVCDLSAGGCRVRLGGKLSVGAAVAVSFQLPDGAQVEKAPCIVRNVNPGGGGFVHGCQFDESARAARDYVEFYVSSTLDRLGAEHRRNNRILFIEEEPGNVEVLRQELSAQGAEVTITHGVVDAFYRIRMVCPGAVLVNCEHNELAGCDICRIIRGTCGLADLPLLVYGGVEDDVEARLMEAGATAWFADASLTEEIMSNLMMLMPEGAFSGPGEKGRQAS